MKKYLVLGAIVSLTVFMSMNSACGGYQGWPGKTTEGTDAKLNIEVSVAGGPLESGLWTFYVAYDNTRGPNMKEISTYRDPTAPFGVFTSDGNGQQHFNDHVGIKVAAAVDRNGDGRISFVVPDYLIVDAFCQTGADPSRSDGWEAHCDKGVYSVIVESNFFTETKQTQRGSRFSNVNPPTNYSPLALAQALGTGSLTGDGAGINISANGISVGEASYTLTSPVSAAIYGTSAAVDAQQAGMKEAAAWLADQIEGLSGTVPVSLNIGGVSVAGASVLGGPEAAAALRSYASQ